MQGITIIYFYMNLHDSDYMGRFSILHYCTFNKTSQCTTCNTEKFVSATYHKLATWIFLMSFVLLT